MKCKSLIAGIALTVLAQAASAEEVLNIYNWAGYTPPDLLEKFTKETGIKVTLDTYDSNESLLAKLKAGGGGYDIVVVANSFLPIFVEEGLLQPIGFNKMEHAGNVDRAKFVDVPWNPKGDYSVPWQWGTNAFAIDSAIYNKPVDSYETLFNPPTELQGKIGMFKSQTDLLTLAEMYLGLPFCTENPKDATKVLDVLKAQKPFVKVYGGSSAMGEQMVGGELAMMGAYSGQTLRRRAQKSSIQYIFPKEGVLGWTDVIAVPKDALHAEAAKKFMDFTMIPENAAMISNFAGYGNGVPAADAFLKPELKGAPELNVPAGIPIHPLVTCSPAATEIEAQIMTELME